MKKVIAEVCEDQTPIVIQPEHGNKMGSDWCAGYICAEMDMLAIRTENGRKVAFRKVYCE